MNFGLKKVRCCVCMAQRGLPKKMSERRPRLAQVWRTGAWVGNYRIFRNEHHPSFAAFAPRKTGSPAFAACRCPFLWRCPTKAHPDSQTNIWFFFVEPIKVPCLTLIIGSYVRNSTLTTCTVYKANWHVLRPVEKKKNVAFHPSSKGASSRFQKRCKRSTAKSHGASVGSMTGLRTIQADTSR